jgi:hypothetical protein
MSARMNAFYAAALVAVVATPAMAQETTPWNLAERNAYVLDMQGKMWSMRVGERSAAMMMKKAKALPRGTVIWQSNGRLYMARAGLWDREGNFMPSGL